MFDIEADEPGYRLVAHADVAIVTWRLAPTIAAVQRLNQHIRTVASRSGGTAYVMVLIDASTGLPDGPTRSAMAESMERAAPLMRHLLAVIQGAGFQAAAIRSVASGMQLLARKAAPSKVFDKPAAAIDWLIAHKGSTDPKDRDELKRAVHFAATGQHGD